jgi:hypothetical protein
VLTIRNFSAARDFRKLVEGGSRELRDSVQPLKKRAALLLFFEVFVLKNVGSGAHKPEPHLLFAGFAIGKALAADHHHFVCVAMIAIVDHFVNAGLPNGITSAIPSAVRLVSSAPRILDTTLKSKSSFACRVNRPGRTSCASGRRAGTAMSITPGRIVLLSCYVET